MPNLVVFLGFTQCELKRQSINSHQSKYTESVVTLIKACYLFKESKIFRVLTSIFSIAYLIVDRGSVSQFF